MAKLQIPLNGSNLTNKDRQQAFQKALDDDHRIDCGGSGKLTVAPEDPPSREVRQPAAPQAPQPQLPRQNGAGIDLSEALDHTYQHQARTMEIHQQYLAQQTEYIQLITAVLDQQGKVLNLGSGNGAAQMMDTFQRTLDNFHAIREQGVRVHQEFLQQQAAFSERYLQALEGRQVSVSAPEPETQAAPAEQRVTQWVVQQPPIIVDDYPSKAESAEPEQSPAQPDRAEIKVRSTAVGSLDSAVLAESLLGIVAEKTGYPADMLEMDMDLEADLGIDSIKRVEILGSLEEMYPELPAADTEVLGQTRTLQEIIDYLNTGAGSQDVSPADRPAPAPAAAGTGEVTPEAHEPSASPAASAGQLSEVLLEIVAEKTGYPADMLEMDMDMEADLGIDSIKRVEILGTMEERVPGLPSVEAETLASLRTLGEIVELMGRAPAAAVEDPAGQQEDKKKAEPLSLERTPVHLKPLPEADRLEFTPDTERPLVLSDDGTDFTLEAAAQLSAAGWKVVVWSFPEDLSGEKVRELPAEIQSVHQKQAGAQGIEAALTELRAEHGSPSGFIHLHPQAAEAGTLFTSREEQLIKQVFLLSGAVKSDLTRSSQAGRNLFLVVLRGDGSLGLGEGAAFQEGSGLAGLAKTLRWEWQDVFCRFIDLSSSLEGEAAARSLVSEIQDPDRSLVEVGIAPNARQTLTRGHSSLI